MPFHIEVLSPSEDSLREVWRFAKLTGDARALSATDLTVLALQLDLERRIEGKRFIRSEPVSGIRYVHRSTQLATFVMMVITPH